jgi:calcium-dependent protein kinase
MAIMNSSEEAESKLGASTPLEEAKQLHLYSNIAVTENPFGQSAFDVYEKVDQIGEGGTGEIWTVRKKSDQTGRLYAMKVIEKEFLFGAFMKELRNEIEVLRSIDHPNVVRTLETFETREYMYLIMEYCSGGDLWSRSERMSESEVACIMNQILSAVAHCHKYKVVHRDIKYENILFQTKEKDSEVVLIDFGMSQKYRQRREAYTMKLQVGTTYTVSPEVIKGKEYTEKTDVWSCGIVCYMLLSGGRRPFDAEKKKHIPYKIEEGEYSMDGPEWENVSHEAKSFVASLLKYDPDERMLAEEALQSPWLVKNSSAKQCIPSPKVMDSVQDALVHVDEEPQLKRLAKMVVAHCAPATRLKELRQAFHALDSTGDGTIRYSEFCKAVEPYGITETQLKEIFAELDQNNTGVVNYTEFLSATLETKGKIDKDLLDEAFQKLDVEDCDAITKEGLSEVVESRNVSPTNEEIAEEILAEIDAEDQVSYEEFINLFD